jgi:SAM-dependent methyltransferase
MAFLKEEHYWHFIAQKFMNKQYFTSSVSSIFYNVFYFYRSGLYKEIKKNAVLFKGTTLDFGCGTMPYKHLFINTQKYVGLDVEISGNPYQKKPDILFDGINIPLQNNTIDDVFCGEVLEHVFNPNQVLSEINRVLKPNGLLLLTCPFTIFEHEVPYDYARYSSFGLTHLLKENNFEIIKFVKSGSYLSTLIQLLCAYIYFIIAKIPVIKHVLFILFITPLLVLGIVFDSLPNFIKRKDLYLNNIVLARKI